MLLFAITDQEVLTVLAVLTAVATLLGTCYKYFWQKPETKSRDTVIAFVPLPPYPSPQPSPAPSRPALPSKQPTLKGSGLGAGLLALGVCSIALLILFVAIDQSMKRGQSPEPSKGEDARRVDPVAPPQPVVDPVQPTQPVVAGVQESSYPVGKVSDYVQVVQTGKPGVRDVSLKPDAQKRLPKGWSVKIWHSIDSNVKGRHEQLTERPVRLYPRSSARASFFADSKLMAQYPEIHRGAMTLTLVLREDQILEMERHGK